ncbi:MAG: hypothetical protein K9G46_11160 [Flavobacteriales bacterium]|nr:hypothetical protein [Flavobacteriales bacterium]
MNNAGKETKSCLEQLKSEYFAEVEKECEHLKTDLMRRLEDWLIPEQGLIVEYESLARRLTDIDTHELSEEDVHLRNAWEDISRGMRYIGGPRTSELGSRVGVAPMPPSEEPVRLQVDFAVRKVHIQSEAAHRYLNWLYYSQGLPLEQVGEKANGGSIESSSNTSTAPQESKDGTGSKKEDVLTETRETVASILDPINDKFIGKDAFEDAINLLCRYFDGEPQLKTEHIKVRRGSWKKLGKALGDIHRDIHHLRSIDQKYLQFAKDTFDCYANHDISNVNLAQNTLYKYMS